MKKKAKAGAPKRPAFFNLQKQRFQNRQEESVAKKKSPERANASGLFGAGDRGRTGTVSLPLDFESSTSANSITPASVLKCLSIITDSLKKINNNFRILKKISKNTNLQ